MESNFQKLRDDTQIEHDALDGALDAALGKYAAVEPRSDLEQRILANLRSEQGKSPARSWWRWSAAGIVAALIVIVAALAWRSNEPTKKLAQHPSAPIEPVHSSPAQVAINNQPNALRPLAVQRTKARSRRVHAPVVVADAPKLDQFPSPEPLTAEELALVRYVRQFPQDAVMIASAQEEFEKEVQREAALSGQVTSNSIEEER